MFRDWSDYNEAKRELELQLEQEMCIHDFDDDYCVYCGKKKENNA